MEKNVPFGTGGNWVKMQMIPNVLGKFLKGGEAQMKTKYNPWFILSCLFLFGGFLALLHCGGSNPANDGGLGTINSSSLDSNSVTNLRGSDDPPSGTKPGPTPPQPPFHGDGTFAAGVDLSVEVTALQDGVLADVNGDGLKDFLITSFVGPGNPLDVFPRNAQGTFDAIINRTNENRTSVTLAIGDFNGDSILDAVVGSNAQQLRAYWGNGDGTFIMGTDLSTVGGSYALAVADFNGDGNLDVLAGYDAPGDNNLHDRNHLFLGDGLGGFSLASPVMGNLHNTRALAVGDINNDGILDFVSGNSGQLNQAWLGNGDGTFNSSKRITLHMDDTHSILLGDYNNDGNLDCVAGNFDRHNRLYLGNGDGTFRPRINIGGNLPTVSMAQAFINDDLHLDLVVGNNAGVNRIYLGDGKGNFDSGNDISSDTLQTRVILLEDLDGDGVLDIVEGNESQTNRIYYGNSI